MKVMKSLLLLGSCRREESRARKQLEVCIPMEIFSALIWSAGTSSWEPAACGAGFISKAKGRLSKCRQDLPEGKIHIYHIVQRDSGNNFEEISLYVVHCILNGCRGCWVRWHKKSPQNLPLFCERSTYTRVSTVDSSFIHEDSWASHYL